LNGIQAVRTIDLESCTGNITRLVGAQEDKRFTNVGYIANAPKRYPARKFIASDVIKNLTIDVGFNRTWSNTWPAR
jgi:hypothetical protein